MGVVRELLGSMTAFDAKAGCVVTSGRFTTDAERFAASRGIVLLDGEALRSLARSTLPLSCGAATLSLEAPEIDESPADAGESVLSPACPVCARTMIERTARRAQGLRGPDELAASDIGFPDRGEDHCLGQPNERNARRPPYGRKRRDNSLTDHCWPIETVTDLALRPRRERR